jgi:hypothetical protein
MNEVRGNPEQLKMVDMALDYLEEDTSRTLGEIKEFSRYTDKLLTDDQIESGAAADEAAAKFAEFNQKLLTSGNQSAGADEIHVPGMDVPAPLKMPGTLASVPASSAKSGSEYDKRGSCLSTVTTTGCVLQRIGWHARGGSALVS